MYWPLAVVIAVDSLPVLIQVPMNLVRGVLGLTAATCMTAPTHERSCIPIRGDSITPPKAHIIKRKFTELGAPVPAMRKPTVRSSICSICIMNRSIVNRNNLVPNPLIEKIRLGK
jgi:hypothetical protein